MTNVVWGTLLAGVVGLPGVPTQRFSRMGAYCLIGLAIASLLLLGSPSVAGAIVTVAGAIGGAIAYKRGVLEGARFWFAAAVATCAGCGLIPIAVIACALGVGVLAMPLIHIRRRPSPKHG
jgi:hypothetical protein